jgi:hypothetical protein
MNRRSSLAASSGGIAALGGVATAATTFDDPAELDRLRVAPGGGSRGYAGRRNIANIHHGAGGLK